MSSACEATSQRVVLNFHWTGSNTWNGGSSRDGIDIRAINLIFPGAQTKISVPLPEHLSLLTPQQFPFKCLRCPKTGRGATKETHPDSLSATIEQIRGLMIKAEFFEKARPVETDSLGEISKQTIQRSTMDVKLNIPEILEPGQTYTLLVSSTSTLRLSADIVTKDDAPKRTSDETQNPAQPSGLDMLSIDELQLRFNAAFKRAQDLASQRMQTAIYEIEALNRLIVEELKTVKLLTKLSAALERKGVTAQIPETAAT